MHTVSRSFSDGDGNLDQEAVIEEMVVECPGLQSCLDADADLLVGRPGLKATFIAQALVGLVQRDDENGVRAVLRIAEQVLVEWDQQGRDFIGACMLEGVPKDGERVLIALAGPLTAAIMRRYM
jgi:hypothetical protein